MAKDAGSASTRSRICSATAANRSSRVADRQLAEVGQVLPHILNAGLILPPRLHRLHLAVGLDPVEGEFEVAAHVVQQPRLVRVPRHDEQRAVGDLGGVVGTALAVLALAVLIDALAQPVVDPRQQQSARPQVVQVGERLADLPAMVRGVYAAFGQRAPRPPHDRRVRLPGVGGGGLVVGGQQVVTQSQIADHERGVGRAVQVADVVQTAGVLALREGGQQGLQRSEQGGVVVVLTTGIHVRS